MPVTTYSTENSRERLVEYKDSTGSFWQRRILSVVGTVFLALTLALVLIYFFALAHFIFIALAIPYLVIGIVLFIADSVIAAVDDSENTQEETHLETATASKSILSPDTLPNPTPNKNISVSSVQEDQVITKKQEPDTLSLEDFLSDREAVASAQTEISTSSSENSGEKEATKEQPQVSEKLKDTTQEVTAELTKPDEEKEQGKEEKTPETQKVQAQPKIKEEEDPTTVTFHVPPGKKLLELKEDKASSNVEAAKKTLQETLDVWEAKEKTTPKKHSTKFSFSLSKKDDKGILEKIYKTRIPLRDLQREKNKPKEIHQSLEIVLKELNTLDNNAPKKFFSPEKIKGPAKQEKVATIVENLKAALEKLSPAPIPIAR